MPANDNGRLVKAGQICGAEHEQEVSTAGSRGDHAAATGVPGAQHPDVLCPRPHREKGGRQHVLLYTGVGMVRRSAGASAVLMTLPMLLMMLLVGGNTCGICKIPPGPIGTEYVPGSRPDRFASSGDCKLEAGARAELRQVCTREHVHAVT